MHGASLQDAFDGDVVLHCNLTGYEDDVLLITKERKSLITMCYRREPHNSVCTSVKKPRVVLISEKENRE